MIKDVEIQYFQAHKSTKFSLKPLLNIITGSTDAGKSSIVVLLRWIFENKPMGLGFRSHFAERLAHVKGKVIFDEGTYVTREKSERLNSYTIGTIDEAETPDPYIALRTDVPDEVVEVTKMGPINIQEQHDPYFLIQDTAAGRAAKLNEVVGLNIIGDSNRNINRIVNQTTGDLQDQKEGNKQTEKDLGALDFLDEVGPLLDRCGKNIERINKLNKEREHIIIKTNRIQHLGQKIEQLNATISLRTRVDYILDTMTVIDGRKARSKRIQASIKQHQTLVKQITWCEDREALKSPLASIFAKLHIIKERSRQAGEIQDSIRHAKRLQERLERESRSIQLYLSEYNELYLTLDICGECGQIIDPKNVVRKPHEHTM